VETAGEEVIPVRVKGAVAETAEGVREVVGEDGEAEAAEKADLIVGRGETVLMILAREVVEGDRKHGVGEGGKVGTNVAGGRRGGGEKEIVLFLEASVKIAAEGGEVDSAVSESREGGWGSGRNEVGVEESGPGRAEKGALASGLGAPGEKVSAVAGGEVRGDAGGVGDADCGKANGAGIGNNEHARGGKGGGAEAKTAEAGGEVEKALGIGREGATGELFEKFEGGGGEGGGKGGGPE
jgi:hypothetical protein